MSSFNEQPNLQPGQEPENAAAPAAGESVTPPAGPEVEKKFGGRNGRTRKFTGKSAGRK